MIVGVVDLLSLLSLWLVAYNTRVGVYGMSGFLPLILLLVWLLLVGVFLWADFHVFLKFQKGAKDAVKHLHMRFENTYHSPVFYVTVALVGYFTILACVDSRRS